MNLDDSFYKHLVDELNEGIYFVNRDRVITYWNRGAERVAGFTSDEVLGARCRDNILMHVDDEGNSLCSTMCPLAATMSDGRPRAIETFCSHKNGHVIPILLRTASIRLGAEEVLGCVGIFADNSAKVELVHRLKELEDLVLLDALTGLPNRRFIDLTIQERLSSLKRYGVQFSLLMMDLDRFKLINDQYGHLVGDRVLRMVARTLAANLRTPDFVGRWGGEEFVAILPYTGPDQFEVIPTRLCRLVEQSTLKVGEAGVSVTVSIGGTDARADDTPESLLARVDHQLYLSKQAGRNRVSVG